MKKQTRKIKLNAEIVSSLSKIRGGYYGENKMGTHRTGCCPDFDDQSYALSGCNYGACRC